MSKEWELIKRSDICPEKWNYCVRESASPRAYALTHYLDVVAPGWKGLVQVENNKYIAVIPLTLTRILGLSLLKQPLFTQQLGVFSSCPKEYTDELIRRFPYIHYQGNSGEYSDQNTSEILRWRTNVVKELGNAEEVRAGYNQNRKRDIKKAIKAGLVFSGLDNPRQVIDLFMSTKGQSLSGIKKRHYQKLHQLAVVMKQNNQAGFYGINNVEGKLIAGGIFTFYQDRVTYLFGSSCTEGKSSGAMTLLLHEVMKKYAATYDLFDFEGSDVAGLKKYYLSFGGKVENYPQYYHNRLNWPFSLVLK